MLTVSLCLTRTLPQNLPLVLVVQQQQQPLQQGLQANRRLGPSVPQRKECPLPLAMRGRGPLLSMVPLSVPYCL